MSVTTKQIANTNKIINFLENEVHPSKFNLRKWIGSTKEVAIPFDYGNPFIMAENPENADDCDTVACVVGWLPYILPDQAEWCRSDNYTQWVVQEKGLMKLFTSIFDGTFKLLTGISSKGTEKIIHLSSYSQDNPTAQDVAQRIREVTATEEINLTKSLEFVG